MSKRLPEITHLQFLVLEALADHDDAAGRHLREMLASYGVKRSGPAFYQMMGRLEDAVLVDGWYEQKLVAGQNLKERRYRLTKTGAHALADTRNFYLARAAAPRRARWVKKAHA
jgi:DNA-binding PadR family transcriptional regulator